MRPTTRLDQLDTTLHHFTGRVVATRPGAEGDMDIALDVTAFYPGGGGQNPDQGTLTWGNGSAPVRSLKLDKNTGVVWHSVAGEVPWEGAQVTGRIDSALRWRHTQRHSAEHLLAQAFHRINPPFHVAAVAMSRAECHLDLKGEPTSRDVVDAEALLSEVLGRHLLNMEVITVPDSDLHLHGLRRPAQVTGQVRLVKFQFQDGTPFDVTACGGTHVPVAAMCAPVHVLRTDRQKAGLTRVTFIAGEEAWRSMSELHECNRALSQQLSVPIPDLTARISHDQTELQAARTRVESLQKQLAETLLPGREVKRGFHAIHLADADAALLPHLLRNTSAGSVLAVWTSDGQCGLGSGRKDLNAGNVLREVLNQTGGRGGGSADLAQGRTERPDQFLTQLTNLILELPEGSSG